jgi:hypothetical protein
MMNGELKRIRKKAAIAYFQIPTKHFLLRNLRNQSQNRHLWTKNGTSDTPKMK